MKDMNSKNDLYRANAIRVLCRIIDSQMLLQIERYLKQVGVGAWRGAQQLRLRGMGSWPALRGVPFLPPPPHPAHPPTLRRQWWTRARWWPARCWRAPSTWRAPTQRSSSAGATRVSEAIHSRHPMVRAVGGGGRRAGRAPCGVSKAAVLAAGGASGRRRGAHRSHTTRPPPLRPQVQFQAGWR